MSFTKLKIQRQSEGFHHGEPQSHKKAVDNVVKFIEKNPRIDVYKEWLVVYNSHFVRREKITWTPNHSYDIALIFRDKPVTMFIEVDGESHGRKDIRGHEQRKIKDGIAEKHANENGIAVIRLDKTECLGQNKEREKYLSDELGKFIK